MLAGQTPGESSVLSQARSRELPGRVAALSQADACASPEHLRLRPPGGRHRRRGGRRRLALLDGISADLDRIFAGPRPAASAHAAPGADGAPGSICRAIHSTGSIAANRQDQTVDALRDRSTICSPTASCPRRPSASWSCASPEGARRRTWRSRTPPAPACSSSEFWQDLGEDADKGRIYVPLEDMDRFGYTVEQFERPRRATSASAVSWPSRPERARRLLEEGRPLGRALPRPHRPRRAALHGGRHGRPARSAASAVRDVPGIRARLAPAASGRGRRRALRRLAGPLVREAGVSAARAGGGLPESAAIRHCQGITRREAQELLVRHPPAAAGQAPRPGHGVRDGAAHRRHRRRRPDARAEARRSGRAGALPRSRPTLVATIPC